MKKELDEALCRDFPKLFRDRNAPMDKTCMCWGFCVGDGWEPLIRECAAKLEALNNKIENPDQYIIAAQVKEKFGGLRFYLDNATEEAYAIVSEAERKADETCEVCGKAGHARGKGWIKTTCEEHAGK